MQSKILSIDSGSSYMKSYIDDDNKLQFPAIIHPVDSERLRGNELKVKDNYYLVGHTAETATNIAIRAPHINEGFHGSQTQYVQICYALERLKMFGKMDRLICSLPYNDMFKREVREQVRMRKSFQWTVVNSNFEEFEREADFEKIAIVPQGVGAMRLHQLQLADTAARRKCRSAMLVDIGSCTTDVITIQLNDESNEYEFCQQACMTIENANVYWFKEQWKDALRFQTRNLSNQNDDYFTLMGYAMRGDFDIQIGDRLVDGRPTFEEVKERFTEYLKPNLIRAAGKKWNEVNVIIFTGGGSHLLNFDVFQDRRIKQFDQWANAIGQMKMFDPPKTEKKVEQAQAVA